MEFLDETELFEKYKDQWVALTDGSEVICSGATLDEVLREAKSKGFDDPVTARIPDLKSELVL